jgi:hypothetical protein
MAAHESSHRQITKARKYEDTNKKPMTRSERVADPPSEDLSPIPEDGEWNVGRIDQDQTRSWLFPLVKPDVLP